MAYEFNPFTGALDKTGGGAGGGGGGDDVILVALTSEIGNVVAGAARASFRMPFAGTLTGVRGSVNEAPTGSAIQVDVNQGGASVFSTVLSIDAAATTSVGSAAPAVISTSALTDNALITLDVDQVGATTPGQGLKVALYVTRS